MLLYIFDQSNKFGKKSKKKFRGPSSAPHCPYNMSFEDPPGDILRKGTLLEGWFETCWGRKLRTSPGCHIGTSPGWSNRIFRGNSEDVGGGRPQDVQWTNVCRMGKSVDSDKIFFNVILSELWLTLKPTNGLNMSFQFNYSFPKLFLQGTFGDKNKNAVLMLLKCLFLLQ